MAEDSKPKWRQRFDKWKNFFREKFRAHAGKVSSIHYQEAHERYWILWRDIETALHKNAHRIPHYDFKEIDQRNLETDGYIDKYFSRNIEELKRAKSSSDDEADNIDNIIEILPYYKIMARNRKRLSTRERDLNTLWQDMNYIRIRLLNEVYQKDDDFDLALHLDFCREEAHSLRVHDDAEIKELLHTAALGLVVVKDKMSNGEAQRKNEQTIRTISTLMARLKRLRLKIFHEQLYRKSAYKGAMFFLLPLAFVLMYGHELILYGPGTCNVKTLTGLADSMSSVNENFMPEFFISIILFPLWLIDTVVGQVFINPLLFIFFSGLVGGFFSAVMKLRDNQGQTEEWAYFKWYIFSIPFVGALGASILYIALKANFVDVNSLFSSDVFNEISENAIGSHGFIFGFLMGFSERIILPKLSNK